MFRIIRAAIFVVALIASCKSSIAATVTLTSHATATYDPNTGAFLTLGGIIDGNPYIYRVDIEMQVAGLAANEAFGLVGYDIALVGLSRNTLNIGGAATGLVNPKPNYVADSPTTNLFVSATGQPLTNYYTGGQNGDYGSSTTDLVGMLTAIDAATLDGLEDADGNQAIDPRLSIGKLGGKSRIGVFYIIWNGISPASVSLTSPLFSTANTVTHQFSNTAPAIVFPFTVDPVPGPEPSSFVLGGLAGIGLLLVRRSLRQSADQSPVIQ